jgi:hypothetical protein
MAQAQGIFVNFLVLALVAAAFGYADFLLRHLISQQTADTIALASPILLLFVFLVTPLVRKRWGVFRGSESWMAWLGIILLVPILWVALGAVHTGWQPLFNDASHRDWSVTEKLSGASTVSAWLIALGSGSAVAGALLTTFGKIRPLLLTVLCVFLRLFGGIGVRLLHPTRFAVRYRRLRHLRVALGVPLDSVGRELHVATRVLQGQTLTLFPDWLRPQAGNCHLYE